MASSRPKPHLVLFPFMAQGHMIPMVDLAKLLAQRGATITIVTTPHNAARNASVLSRATASGLPIHVAQLQFPWRQVGLPEGCENIDLLPSLGSTSTFLRATTLLYDPSDQLLDQLNPPPTYLISDLTLPWTLRLAKKHHLPRLVFYPTSCFFLNCIDSLMNNVSDSDRFVTISDIPGGPIRFLKTQLPKSRDEEMCKFGYEMVVAAVQSDGVVINTFEEMEPEYYRKLEELRKYKVWCVGPVSLYSSHSEVDKVERGNTPSIGKHVCVTWLDAQHASSVVYASMGSICNMGTAQMIELGLGLEESNRPFIWVIRQGNLTHDLEKWLAEYGYEERTKGRGLVIRGWAPQVVILSHPSVGCFLTHSGWNSNVEGISAGLPLITWPLFADHVFNGKLMVEILRVGVSVGEDTVIQWGEEQEKKVAVKRERVSEAIEMVMNNGNEAKERRERCKKLAQMANRAVEEGGSSYRNLDQLIRADIVCDHGRGCDQNRSCTVLLPSWF